MAAGPDQAEDRYLAAYAMRNSGHGERLHGAESSVFRTPFQRDRDRVIHSKSFRRLGYKTQVFANSAGDNYRTRLTHSIEVGQISRSVAAALDLNRDFAETLALAHDLGHTPFGHAGQDALHEQMADHGGFEHNQQSLRIVAKLESRYTEYPGLNLTRAVLVGMMKHARVYTCDSELQPLVEERRAHGPSLEAALVDLCDRIAYIHHDLEDGMDAGILSLDELFELAAWQAAYRETEARLGTGFSGARPEVRFRAVLRALMNAAITDLIETIARNLAAERPGSLADVYQLGPERFPVRLSPDSKELQASFQRLLFDRVYRNPAVLEMSRRGKRIIATLFAEYMQEPRMMPMHFQERLAQEGTPRVVSDYIAGMTDRYALKKFLYLTGQEGP